MDTIASLTKRYSDALAESTVDNCGGPVERLVIMLAFIEEAQYCEDIGNTERLRQILTFSQNNL
jgi:hypothetical protein